MLSLGQSGFEIRTMKKPRPALVKPDGVKMKVEKGRDEAPKWIVPPSWRGTIPGFDDLLTRAVLPEIGTQSRLQDGLSLAPVGAVSLLVAFRVELPAPPAIDCRIGHPGLGSRH